MFKSKAPLPTLQRSKGCEGCSKRTCPFYIAAVSPEYNENYVGGPYGCNDSINTFVIIYGSDDGTGK